MREIDFLPGWYPVVRKRRRALRIQIHLSAVILAATAVYAARLHQGQGIDGPRRSDAPARSQMVESPDQFRSEIEDETKELSRLRHQVALLETSTSGVETTRLLAEIQNAMPAEVTLTALSAESMHGEINVVLDGTCPADSQAAEMYTRLSRVAFFRDLQLVYLRDANPSHDRGRRAFRMTFHLPSGSVGGML